MKLNALTIKHRLVLALIFAVICSTALVGFISQNKAHQVVEDRLLAKELPATLMQIRNSIDKEVSGLLAAAEQLATDQFILRASAAGMAAPDESLLLKHLEGLRQQYGVNDVSFADRQSHYYWTQNGLLRQLNREQDGWFFDFITSGRETMLSLYAENGQVKLYVNYQQLNGRGLSALAKTMDEMQAFIQQFTIEQSGFVYLTDVNGLIQLHGDQSLAGKQRLADNFTAQQAATLLGKNDFNLVEIERNGEPVLIASSYIPAIDWFVVAEVPKNEAFAELNTALTDMLLWSVVIALIFMVLAVFLATNITKPINNLARVFRDLGEGDGDLSYRINIEREDEMGQLASGFNQFINKIHHSVRAVAQTGIELGETATTVANQAQQTLNDTESQRDRTHQLGVAINEMAATISEIANNATQAADTARDADGETNSGQAIVGQASTHIQQLANDVQSVTGVISSLANNTLAIGSILEVIRGVSEQTNLLALNAAIEAARAGEQGRGFAVVADEVRNLASRTAASTDEIQTMINQLQSEAQNAVDAMSKSSELTDEGVTAAQQASHALANIAERISQITDINTQVATATEEQSTVVVDINNSIEDINGITQQTADTANSMSHSSQQLQRLSHELAQMVGEFRL